MKLDEEGLTNYSVGRTFQREKRINFLDFSYDGQRLITSGEDDQMVIYDCEKGTEKQVMLSSKPQGLIKSVLGCEISEVRLRPGSLHSRLQHDCLRLEQGGQGSCHPLYVAARQQVPEVFQRAWAEGGSNRFEDPPNSRTTQVVSLSVSPVDDTILSGSLDRTARLWDLRAPDCLGLMQCQVEQLLGGGSSRLSCWEFFRVDLWQVLTLKASFSPSGFRASR